MLAAAQAFLLRRLLFEPQPSVPAQRAVSADWLAESATELNAQPSDALPSGAAVNCLLPDEATATDALLRGLADILWQAATARSLGLPQESSPATVALLSNDRLPFAGSTSGLVAELLSSRVRANTWLEVYTRLKEGLPALMSEVGALSFLISTLLSRGIAPFRAERDDADLPLIDPQHGE